MVCSFSLLVQRKRTKRKDTFFKAFFSKAENQICFPKILPRLQNFLTKNKFYAVKKGFQSAALERQYVH